MPQVPESSTCKEIYFMFFNKPRQPSSSASPSLPREIQHLSIVHLSDIKNDFFSDWREVNTISPSIITDSAIEYIKTIDPNPGKKSAKP